MLVLKIGSIVLLHNYYVITKFSDALFFFLKMIIVCSANMSIFVEFVASLSSLQEHVIDPVMGQMRFISSHSFL
jgi:hypothetical protein